MIPPITRTRRRRKARRALRAKPELPPAVNPKPSGEADAQSPPAAAPSPEAPPTLDIDGMTKREIMSELRERDVDYSARSSRATLARKLWAAVMAGGE